MTKKEIIRNLKYTMEKHKNDRVDTFGTNISLMCKDILDYLEKEPCGKDINVPATDCISRQAAIDSLGECPMNWTDSDAEITAERDWKDTVEMLKSLPSVNTQEPYKDFCEFVAKMVLRDDFEENAGANAEFLCRKLSKLGIVKADKDEWVLAESEDENA